MGDEAPAATKEDIDNVHSRIDRLEAFLHNALEKVEGWIGVARPAVDVVAKIVEHVAPGTVASAAAVVDAVVDAAACPAHPDAPQTANGCSAAGCTFGVRDWASWTAAQAAPAGENG